MKDIGLLRELAWSFHKSTGLDWDDLFQEAALAYLEAYKGYDKSKGKVTTYMWHVITSRLIDYVRREKKQMPPWSTLDEVKSSYRNESIWESLPLRLEREFEILLKGIAEIECSLSREEKMDKISKMLSANHVSPSRINQVLKEII